MSTRPSEAIERLMKAQEDRAVDDGSGDVIFALFLEPHQPNASDGPPSTFDKIVSYAVNHLQPSPVMVHVELVVPCAEGTCAPVNFATYIGSKSNWQGDAKYNAGYYLGTTANKWRAVPVFGKHAARLVRGACDQSCGVDYSLLRYVTAAWGFRRLSPMLSDGPKDPAHCATLVARMLKRGVSNVLRHPSAWYGPATLYAELCSELRNQAIVPATTSMEGDVAANVDKLLRQRDDDVSGMSDGEFMSAIRALTLKASAAGNSDDAAMSVMMQKQLANALFRWSVLRKPGAH